MNGLKLMGSISLVFGIVLLLVKFLSPLKKVEVSLILKLILMFFADRLLPLLSTPVVKGLAFWRAVFKINDLKIEVKTGFWGACTYYEELSDSSELDFVRGKNKRKRKPDTDVQVKCTKAKAGYSFKMDSTVPDAAGELSSTQTFFLFWLVIGKLTLPHLQLKWHPAFDLIALFFSTAAFIALISFALSFSPNYYQWKHAAILALSSSVLGFGTFLACVVVFAGLTRETRLTESATTIPLYGALQGCTFFPLSASILLGIGASLLWLSYRQEFFKLHRRASRAAENRTSSTPETTLPPPTLGNAGISREEWGQRPRESRHGTEIPREVYDSNSSADDEVSQEDSRELELEEIRSPYTQHPSEADDERDTETESQNSILESSSLASASLSYIHPSDGLPPPPPLQLRHDTRLRPTR
ncbi:hypothetical protein VP01_51g4 [Puccinia sorghi]|uniref:Uncharacterized protein n=1 Tax=Puccinia sorghi TaxID=27349 RepID=A0A0L6UKQ0_9BASI|nr:hypothetical protein VP01_51g4 [Puccinia sorghi]